jgi:prolyl-tRNA synthetase
MEKNQCVLVRRDNGEKTFVSLDGIEETVGKMLDDIHNNLYAKAKKNLEDNTYPCTSLEEVKEKMAERGGFAKTMWCGDLECELKMKEEAGVSSRCIPLEQEHLGDTCAICGKPAKHMVYWGVAY